MSGAGPAADVSVIIPHFNRPAFLDRALESVSRQTLPVAEVIVVDDGSEPEQWRLAREVLRRRGAALPIQILRSERNQGANAARNRGIDAATRRYVAFLDCDDLWMPEKIRTQYAAVRRAQGLGKPVLSVTGRFRVDESGDILAQQSCGRTLDHRRILESNCLGTLSAAMVETAILRLVGGFDESLPACQDWDLFIRLSRLVAFEPCPEPLCVYVDHAGDRITGDHGRRLKAHMQILEKHIRPYLRSGRLNLSAFYRNIAEDLDLMNRPAEARRFMALSKAGRLDAPWSALMVQFYQAKFALLGMASPKRRRYEGYRRRLRRKLRQSEARHVVGMRQQALRTLFAAVDQPGSL